MLSDGGQRMSRATTGQRMSLLVQLAVRARSPRHAFELQSCDLVRSRSARPKPAGSAALGMFAQCKAGGGGR